MAKGIMYIDGQRVPFDGEKNVLAVIRKAGIEMPTFCYYSELSVYGACRMCVVEDEKGKIDTSCSMEPRDGMKIRTNTARLLKHRRMILELMLSSHCRDCTTCEKAGTAACRSWRCGSACGVSALRIPVPVMNGTPLLRRWCGTPTSAFSAVTVCGYARRCRGSAF